MRAIKASIPVEFCSERDGRVSIKLGGLGGGNGFREVEGGVGVGAGLVGLSASPLFALNESARHHKTPRAFRHEEGREQCLS